MVDWKNVKMIYGDNTLLHIAKRKKMNELDSFVTLNCPYSHDSISNLLHKML